MSAARGSLFSAAIAFYLAAKGVCRDARSTAGMKREETRQA